MSINLEKLNNIIENFKQDYDVFFKEEVYKYEAIKTFQENWNENAKDFAEMLEKALSKSANLLVARNYFPKKMLIEMAKFEPETVRKMLINLFDETQSIKERFDNYTKTSRKLVDKYWNSQINAYQDACSMSVLLTFRYPDKYYMYKTELNNKVALELGVKIKNDDKEVQLENYYNFCNLIKENIVKDKELLNIVENNGLYKQYYDNYFINEVVYDLLYYAGEKLEKQKSDLKSNSKINFKSNSKSKFTWVKIYNNIAKELAKRTPEDNAELLYEMLEKSGHNIKEPTAINFDTFGVEKIKYEEIDPISFMNRFDAYGKEKRLKLIETFKKITGINNELPKDFDGIPSVEPRNPNVISSKNERGEEDIQNVTQLFKYALKMSELDDTFIELYDKVVVQKNASYGISVGLYKIRPDLFLNLDSTNREYIKEKMGRKITTCPNGSEYCTIIKEVKEYIENNSEISNFLDFSFEAWNASKKKSLDYKIWLYSPGEQANLWDEFYVKGIMAIGWDELKDIKGLSKNEIDEKLKNTRHDTTKTNSVLAIYEFANKISIGDIVIVKRGVKELLGYGIVTSDYYYDDDRPKYKHVRKVDWKKKGEWIFEHKDVNKMARKTLTDLSKYEGFGEEILDMMKDNTNYYWLNANPKIWSYNDIKVGETIEYTSINENGNKRRIYTNYLEAKKGDKIIAYESTPTKKIVGICEVDGPLNSEGILIVRKIENLINPVPYSEVIKLDELQNSEMIKNSQGSLFKLTEDEYNAILDMIRENNPKQEEKSIEKYTKEDFLKYVTLDNDKVYDEIITILKTKKNIILQGAPGVGKTYMARELAYALMEEKADDRIEFVQFHQSYGYEDFVEGYRPKEDGDGFESKTGIFYDFCYYKASSNPEKRFVFIIDEINRGNISKIFGELLMLIEKDKRDQKVKLSYTGKTFKVPANVYIIGMMNTADRSLAIIDYALRRRFAFYTVLPLYESDTFKAKIDSLNNAKLSKIVDKIKDINKEIREDSSLGEGFEIGHSYFINLKNNVTEFEIEMIVKYEILPLLKEYWFDEESKYNKYKDELLGVFNDKN